jgi:hypothetical protein
MPRARTKKTNEQDYVYRESEAESIRKIDETARRYLEAREQAEAMKRLASSRMERALEIERRAQWAGFIGTLAFCIGAALFAIGLLS